MAFPFTDVDESELARTLDLWGTIEKLALGVSSESEDALDSTRFFLLTAALKTYAAKCGFSNGQFYDLTGSRGKLALAASLLNNWRGITALEPSNADVETAVKLYAAANDRRRRRAKSTQAPSVSAPPVDFADSRRLWKAEWIDADFAVFDASRACFADFLDEGIFTVEVLWRGLARAPAGTHVLLITSADGEPEADTFVPREGAAACAVLETLTMRDRFSGAALTSRLLRVLRDSDDANLLPRLRPPRVSAAPGPAHLPIKGEPARRTLDVLDRL
mmetsp:Transcript_6103/g.19550  ORF Transcript_6103/g.19550 Transcript_6103/m.19550 type:complete len:276 (+) Transcript_6103:48-875(+)